MRRRARSAATQGLAVSLLLGAPLGWSLAQSSLRGMTTAGLDGCPEVVSFLPPTLQRQIQRHRSQGSLTATERQTLDLKVCDPALRAVLRPILGGVTDLGSLREMAEHVPRGGGAEALPDLKSLLSATTGD